MAGGQIALQQYSLSKPNPSCKANKMCKCAELCRKLEKILGCKVDVATEDPLAVNSIYLPNSVSLNDENLETKLQRLFGVELTEVKFPKLNKVEKFLAKKSYKPS